MRTRRQRRYPVTPILHLLNGLTLIEAGERAGVAPSRVHSWRKDPTIEVTEYDADRIAITLGTHPGNLWDNWFDISSPIPPRYKVKQTA